MPDTSERALTPQAHALGVGLRAARDAAGYGLRELADKLRMNPSTLSRWERGARHPRVEDVGIILGALDVDTDERERLLSLARDSETPQWVSLGPSEQQRQMATLLHYEQDADQITDVSQFIPGLLQTEDYARAVMRAGMVPADEIGTRVAIRLGRRDMLRTRSTKLIALIGEAALHYQVGGRDVLLDQLRYLLEVAAWDTVDLRIVPFAAGWHEGLLGAFIIVDRAGQDPVVHVETPGSSLFLHERMDTTVFRAAADRVRALAMSPSDSTEFIAGIIREHERNQ